jgi:PAS domain S-box-containing protein
MDPSMIPTSIFVVVVGFAVLAGAWLAAQALSRTRSSRTAGIESLISVHLASVNDAVIVARVGGQVIFANEHAQRWFGLEGAEPDLWLMAQRVEPPEAFLELFASEGQALLMVGELSLEATSHRVTVGEQEQFIVVLREETQLPTLSREERGSGQAMMIISEISRAINASLELEATLDAILENVRRVIDYDAAEICLWEQKTEDLIPVARAGHEPFAERLQTEEVEPYALEQGYTGWLARNRQPLLIGDVSDREDIPSKRWHPDDPSIRSYVGIPLSVRNRFIGTLEIVSFVRNTLDREDLGILRLIGEQAAIAIENARQYSQQVERIAELSGLQKIAQAISVLQDARQLYTQLGQRLSELMGVDMAGVLLYDNERQALIPQKPLHGVPDAVTSQYRISMEPGGPARAFWDEVDFWFTNDVEEDHLVRELGLAEMARSIGLHTTALATMRVGDDRIGVLQVSNKSDGSRFNLSDIRLLQIYAEQAAIVVGNARLYAEEQSRVAELEGLQQIAQTMSAFTNPDELYAQLTTRIAELMGVEICGILLYDPNQTTLVPQTPFYGLDNELAQQFVIPVPSGSRSYRLWQESDLFASNNVGPDGEIDMMDIRGAVRDAGVRNLVLAPLSAGGRRFGMLQVANKADGTDFDEDDERVLKIFAGQAAALIENARLYQNTDATLRSRITELRSVSRISHELNATLELKRILDVIATEAVRAEGARCGGVMMFTADESYSHFIPMMRFGCPPGGGQLTPIELACAQSGKTLVVEDFTEDQSYPPPHDGVRSALVVPIHFEGKAIGLVQLHSDRPRAMGSSVVEFAQALSSQASIAVGNATRHTEQVERGELLRRRADQLTQIFEVSRMFRSDQSVVDSLADIAQAIRESVGFNAVLISTLDPEREYLWRVAQAGLAPEVFSELAKNATPWKNVERQMRDEFLIGSASYFIPHTHYEEVSKYLDIYRTMPEAEAVAPGQWHPDDLLFVTLHSSSGDVMGILSVDNPQDGAVPSETTVELLEIFGNQAALVIENSRLYQSVEERAEELDHSLKDLQRSYEELDRLSRDMIRKDMELEAANELLDLRAQRLMALHRVMESVDSTRPPCDVLRDIARSVIEEMDVNQCAIILEQGAGDAWDLAATEGRFPKGMDLPGKLSRNRQAMEAYRKGEATILNGAGRKSKRKSALLEATGSYALIMLPLSMNDEHGMLLVGTTHKGAEFSEDDRDLFTLLSSQVVVEYENARLYEAVQKEAAKATTERDRLQQLHVITTALQQTRDLPTRLRVIARGVRLVGWQRVAVILFDEKLAITHLVMDEDRPEDEKRIRKELGKHKPHHKIFDPEYASQRVGTAYMIRHPDQPTQAAWYTGDILFLPMYSGMRVMGMIRMDDPLDGLRPTDESIRPLELFAQQAASALENARLYQETLTLQSYNEAVVQSIQQGIIVTDAEGVVESFNEFMRTQYGWDDSIVGKDLFAERPALRDLGIEEALRTALETNKPVEKTHVKYRAHTEEDLTLNIYIYPRYDESRQVTGAVSLLEDVTQRIRLEEDIALRGQQLAVLSEVSRVITATLSADEVVNTVLNQAQKVLIHDRVALWLREQDGKKITIAGARGYDDDEAVLGLQVEIADSALFNELARTKEPLLIPDTRKDGRFPSEEPYPMQTWLGAPLVSGGLVLGVLTLEKSEPGFYASADMQVAQAFASQTAIALDNARLFEEAAERATTLHSQAERLALLSRISSGLARSLDMTGILQSAVNEMAEALEVDKGYVFMFEADASRGKLMVMYPSRVDGTVEDVKLSTTDNPTIAHLQQALAPLCVEDAAEDPLLEGMRQVVEQMGVRSALLLPLTLGGGAMIGLIVLGDTRRQRHFESAQVELGQTITNQAAVAVQNARLFQETVERQGEIEIVFQAGQIASSSLDLDTVVRNTTRYFVEALGVDGCTIALWEPEQGELVTLIDYAREEGLVNTEERGTRHAVAAIPGAEAVLEHRGAALFGVGDETLDREQAEWLRERGFSSTLTIPLIVRDATIGLLTMWQTRPESAFVPRDRRLAQALANTIATAMENARLHDETQKRVAELTTINEIGRAITQTIAAEDLYNALEGQLWKVVGARSMTLALHSAEMGQMIFPLAVRNGLRVHHTPTAYSTDLYSYLVEHGTPLLVRRDVSTRTQTIGIKSVEPGLRSFLGVPLFSADRAIGALTVEDYEQENAFSEADLRVIGTIAAQVAVAIENTRLYSELEQRLSETTTLQEVSRVVNSALDLKEIFERVVTELADAFNYPVIDIFSLSGRQLHLEAHHGFSDEAVSRYSVLSMEQGIAGRAVRTGEPQFVAHIHQDDDYLEVAPEIESQISVPIISDGIPLGVLDVQGGSDNPLDDNDLQLLRAFAGQVATAMHNASLYTQMLELSEELERRVEERTRELQAERDRIDTLFRITSELSASLDLDRVLNRALELVGEAVSAAHGSLFLIDPQSDRLIYRAVMSDYEILPPGGRQIALTRHEGMAGWVMDNRQAVIIGNVQLDPRWADVPGTEERRSLLGAPLVANEDVLGCIFFASDKVDAFNDAHLLLVEAAANQVATSINNAELYRMIRDQAERLGGMLRSQQTEAAKSQAILEGIADGVMVSDAAGEIILFNAAAERILDLRRDDVLGRPSSDLTGLYGAGAQKWADMLNRWVEARSTYEGDFLTEQIEVGDRVVSVHVSPVLHGTELLGLVSVFRDITAEVEADRIKSEFVANVSHELRTPMTSIKGYADLLLLGAAGDITADQRRFLEIVKSNADRLSMLVNDLLDISRIEQGRVDLDIRQIDIREIVNDVLLALEGRREEEGRSVPVHTEMPDELPMLLADYDRVTQVLTNLVNNAYQYTPDGGSITVRVTEEEQKDDLGRPAPGVRIDVRDTGIGIAPDEQERVFERFYRGEDPLVMQTAGTGLGLSIVQHLVEMHKGLVWFESELGIGTTFSIWLPLKRQPK